jgi:uncharacterized phage protein (TIGR01671 family)
MREIKFRAYIKSQKIMIYPHGFNAPQLDKSGQGELKIQLFGKNAFDNNVYEGDAEDVELMQFTGLKDINKIEIYEGDIVTARDVRHKSSKIIRGIIDYANGSFCINDGICTHYRWIDYGVEVIGNIYENSELLEVK